MQSPTPIGLYRSTRLDGERRDQAAGWLPPANGRACPRPDARAPDEKPPGTVRYVTDSPSAPPRPGPRLASGSVAVSARFHLDLETDDVDA